MAETHRLRRLRNFLLGARTSLTVYFLTEIRDAKTDPHTLLLETDLIENYASNISSIIACIRCRWNFLSSRYPATEVGTNFTDPLAISDRRDSYTKKRD
jgi:hypothetical protein